ncbi:MAG: 2TM domain-containing protein [Ardenticatenia bacterium]|nr:2TM domain-containing protein [Ardenticatenia bacterium]
MSQTQRVSSEHRYSPEDVKAILNRAVELSTREEGFSRVQLFDMARELGLSEEVVLRAEEEWLARANEEEERQQFIAKQRQEFREHVVAFVIVNAAIVAINLLVTPSFFWAIFPIIGWGIGLAFHAVEALPVSGPKFEARFERWRRKQRLKRQLKNSATSLVDRAVNGVLQALEEPGGTPSGPDNQHRHRMARRSKRRNRHHRRGRCGGC